MTTMSKDSIAPDGPDTEQRARIVRIIDALCVESARGRWHLPVNEAAIAVCDALVERGLAVAYPASPCVQAGAKLLNAWLGAPTSTDPGERISRAIHMLAMLERKAERDGLPSGPREFAAVRAILEGGA